MKNIIFVAPPAAGKGTQANLISKYYGIPHISLGDIMREARDPNTEVGRIIINCLDTRQLVPFDIVMRLLNDRLNNEDCNNGYILDGFPRNIEQAIEYDKILNNLNKDIGIVIYMEINKDLALKRTLSRIVCPKCNATYNMINDDLKPKKDGICDICGCDLKIRTDDNKETFIKGFETYMKETLPLIEYYKDKNKLIKIEVNENKTTNDIFNEIKKYIA